MKLKTLELFGFKSFVNKTTIQFSDGISGVVGPNGAGKSNLVDAIRWVMGEQSAKHLRGNEMQDVIFNGTSGRAPLGMAQVVLKFDTSDGQAPAGYTDYSEIQVERRLYRSGESEYYINKVPCRWRDIIDLFLGTGIGTKAYSIIEQGKIDQIVSAKPEERRRVIEEAAGISKFKNRKEAALRKIESTEANLARLEDVIAEIKRQLNSLDRQARKAERYQKLFGELKERELKVSGFRYQQLRAELDRLEKEETQFSQEDASLASQLATTETSTEREKIELATLEQDLNQRQEEYYIHQNATKLHEATLEHQASKLKDIQRQSETNSEEIETFRQKLGRAETEVERLNQIKVTLDVSLANLDERLQAAQEQLALQTRQWNESQGETENLNRQMLSVVGAVAESQSRLEYLERRGVEMGGRIAQGQAEIDALDKKTKDLDYKIKNTESALEDLKQLSFKIGDEASQVKGALQQKQKELQTAFAKLEELKGDLALKQSRLKSQEEIYENLDGYKEGVRTVLRASKKELSGVCGPVSAIIDTEEEYETAVNAVLGEKLQYVVVKSQEEGVEALDYLRQQSKGRSTFVPLNIRGADSLEKRMEGEGVVGPLLEKVRFSDDYKQIANYLFGDCILVEDLRKALRLWNDGLSDTTLVTLQGEVLDQAGVLTGGTGNEQELLLGQKRRMEEMQREMALAKLIVTEAEGEIQTLKKQIQGLEERLDHLSRESHGEDIRKVQQERDGLRLREELGRHHQDRDRLSLEIARSLDEKRETEKAIDEVILLLDGNVSRQQSLEKELGAGQARLARDMIEKERGSQVLFELRGQLSQTSEKVSATEGDLTHWIQAKLELKEGIEKRIAAINLGQNETRQLLQSQKSERKGLEESLRRLEGLKVEQKEIQEKYQVLSRQVKEKEMKLREVRHRHEEVVEKKHVTDLQLAESSNQLQVLIDQMLERYKVELGRYVLESPVVETVDFEEEKQQIQELRDKVEKLGSVHVGAIEEYDELKERYEFLTKQREDLVQSLESLKKAIQKINRVSKERFLKTFDLVNQKFQEVFPRLFKGGRAKLILADEQNLLETGVEIVAQPPGKKLQSISLLSGGEKALTAVALVFSIFLIKPSPFCLLDEVDAPLDDANIDRFNDMVHEMTGQSQFIVITHNKRTMERADCLYGITMEEAGVSKVVSVKLGVENKAPLSKVA